MSILLYLYIYVLVCDSVSHPQPHFSLFFVFGSCINCLLNRSGGLQQIKTLELSRSWCFYTCFLSHKQGQLWECCKEGSILDVFWVIPFFIYLFLCRISACIFVCLTIFFLWLSIAVDSWTEALCTWCSSNSCWNKAR